MKKTLLIFLLLAVCITCNAKIELPSILSDNMVLQQNVDVRLWGKAKSNTRVTVKPSWSKTAYSTISDSEGKWLINVLTPSAGGPYEIEVSDNEAITLKNILIGEVWYCSGQSNMQMGMGGFDYEPVQGGSEVALMAKEKTPIRIFSTDFDANGELKQYSKTQQENCKGQWLTNKPEYVINTSATAYFFAKYLQEVLDVPIGIVVSSWGGSSIESWMSKEAIQPFGVDLSHLEEGKEITGSVQRKPCLLFNAKVAPLMNYTIKGMIWYQGEENRHMVNEYAQMLPIMVSDYRQRWNIGNFPFYYVELAPYAYEDVNRVDVAYFREMQLKLMEKIPNSGIALTTDIGDPYTIHPSNKAAMGKRLAHWALVKDYGRTKIGYLTPTYKSMEVEGNKIYISFENAKGNTVHPIQKPLSSFEIAGEDKVFYPANAIVDLKTRRLTVWNDEVQIPVAVRYAFKNYAEASLFDSYGLPVAAFRTDNWQ